MKGTKTEVRPGVWRLRVYVGRRPNGTPIQVTKTIDTTEGKTVKPGSGVRRAEAELAAMVAKLEGGTAGSATTVGGLLDRFIAHAEAIGRAPTTTVKYR